MSTVVSDSLFVSRQLPARTAMKELSWPERFALALGIFEIPLQIDKYLMFHENDANQGAVAGINISITSMALAFLYLSWLSRLSQQRLARLAQPIIGVPMIIYLATILFSTLSAQLPLLSIFDFILVLQAYLLFFYLANRIRTRFDLTVCLLALCCTLLFQSAIIFLVFALRIDDELLTFGPLTVLVWEGHRQGGTMQSPVLAGSTLALMWLPIAGLLIAKVSSNLRIIALVTSAASILSILLTQTRGAILTTFVGCTLIGMGMMVRGWLPKWTLAVSAALLCISLYPLWIVYEKRVKAGDGDSAVARKHLSLIALEMIEKRPIRGYGAGNCHLAGKRFADQGKYRSEWYYTIHCKYLLVWIETGLLGILSFLAVLGHGIKNGLVAWMQRDRLWSPLGLAVAAAIMGHAVHMAVDVFNSRTQVQMLWVILGISAAIYRLTVLETQHETRLHTVVSTRTLQGAAQ